MILPRRTRPRTVPLPSRPSRAARQPLAPTAPRRLRPRLSQVERALLLVALPPLQRPAAQILDGQPRRARRLPARHAAPHHTSQYMSTVSFLDVETSLSASLILTTWCRGHGENHDVSESSCES